MEGAPVRLRPTASYIDTTPHPVHLRRRLRRPRGDHVADARLRLHLHVRATTTSKILDRLNTRVKPTDLFIYGLIPEFTGRLPIIARFRRPRPDDAGADHDRAANSIYRQFREIFRHEGVELTIEPRVFEQIAELAIEYKTGARSLRGIFEELITPVLYVVPDDPDIEAVRIASLFTTPTITRRTPAA